MSDKIKQQKVKAAFKSGELLLHNCKDPYTHYRKLLTDAALENFLNKRQK